MYLWWQILYKLNIMVQKLILQKKKTSKFDIFGSGRGAPIIITISIIFIFIVHTLRIGICAAIF